MTARSPLPRGRQRGLVDQLEAQLGILDQGRVGSRSRTATPGSGMAASSAGLPFGRGGLGARDPGAAGGVKGFGPSAIRSPPRVSSPAAEARV